MIKYNEGIPEKQGKYACRIPDPDCLALGKDVFLMWVDNGWSYPGSDQNYRGEVLGWIGPLDRIRPK